VGECFFWYRPARVVPDQKPLNGCVCLCVLDLMVWGGSVAEWLACWTQCSRAWVQIAAAMLSGNSLRQTVHTHCASVHRAAKLVAALLRVEGCEGNRKHGGK